MGDVRDDSQSLTELGPAKLDSFPHVSVPCRDLEESAHVRGSHFYKDLRSLIPLSYST
jgi:hypothetical protein